ncbi:AimR family lysis-lysogeny pheromone receptor [Oceanobacillus bengalensis]|uniref:AimR family lysis-lysogeny pheromone receptor n=1 Tax=Oceanobacillus bengalensis TaxID=1435466 RepID=UPI0011C34AE2
MSANILLEKKEQTWEQFQERVRLECDIETETQMMRRFFLQTSSIDVQKKGLEFLYMNGFYDDLQLLIKINQQSDYTSNRNWARIYQILLDTKSGQYSPEELLQQLEQLHTQETEVLCLKEFAKINIYYNRNQYNEFGNFLNTIEQLFLMIDDYFLLDYFKLRISQIYFVYSLMKNELIIARKYGYKVLTLTKSPSIQVDAHIKLGLSYTFDSYSQGIYHLEQALKIAKKHHLTEKIYLIEQRNIPFLSAKFKKVENISTNDISEQAHIEIAKGNDEKAVELLEDVSLDTPFRLYYMGKAKGDRNLLIRAYKEFIHERGDYFFSRLPLDELRKIYI